MGRQKPLEIQQGQIAAPAPGMDGLTQQESWGSAVPRQQRQLAASNRRAVVDRQREVIIPLFLTIIKLCLKYNVQFWTAWCQKDIDKTECVEGMVTSIAGD